MDIVIENSNIFNNKKEINSKAVEDILSKIDSATERRRQYGSMMYFIAQKKDKEMNNEKKMQIIKELNTIFKKVEEIKKKENKNTEEEEDEKQQSIETVTMVELAKQPNSKGNFLKKYTIQVNAPNYPIAPLDQVNYYLDDIQAYHNMIFAKNDKERAEMYEDMNKYKIKTPQRIVPQGLTMQKVDDKDGIALISNDLSNLKKGGKKKNKKTKRKNKKRTKTIKRKCK
jgi:hypothetical protein